MVEHLIVPVDDSESSWNAFDVALGLARSCQGHVDVVQVVADQASVAPAEQALREHVVGHDPADVPVRTIAVPTTADVAATLAEIVERHPGATPVMASHGRGRSAALLGSVAEELLRLTFGPMILVGPRAGVPDFSKPIVVAIDGSDVSESAVPLAAAWAIELGSAAWIVEVLDGAVVIPPDIADSAYAAALARRMKVLSGRDVNYEVLHGRDPVDAVVDFSESRQASLIVAGTHGRSGAHRLALGSVAAGFVKRATCPVLLVRPPHLMGGHRLGAHADATSS